MQKKISLFLILQVSTATLNIGLANPNLQVLPPEIGYIVKNKQKQLKDKQPISHKIKEAKKLSPPVQNFIKKLERKKQKLIGGAVAILYKGQVIYKNAFGYAKVGDNQLITTHTLFPLASLSKPLSATAVALLVNQGKLNFKERFIFSYLKYPVTLKNILGHTTGYAFSGNSQIEAGIERIELLKKISLQKPQGQVGMYYCYSNTMFSLLEEALQAKKINLQSLLNEFKKAIHTTEIALAPEDTGKPLAYPHLSEKLDDEENYKSLPLPSFYEKVTPSATGIFASLEAMIKTCQASFGYGNNLIAPKILDNLYRTGIANRDIDKWKINWPCPSNKIQSYYGLGWRILKVENQLDKDLIFHSGYIAGVATYIGFIPEEEMSLIILLNQQSRLPLEWGIQFWGDFFK